MPSRPRSHRSVVLGAAVLALALAGIVVAALAQPPAHVRHHHRHHHAAAAKATALAAQPTPQPHPSGKPAGRVPSRKWLRVAEAAYGRTHAWWDPSRGWYRQFLPGHGSGTATVWGIVHLFEATDAIAMASPTKANVAAARSFANTAEGYWDPNLRPVPGYGPSLNGRGTHAWYDDEAWWAVAYYDAYRATHDKRFLTSASKALAFIDSGWDRKSGGIFWDTNKTFKASESLAGGTLTAAGLYQITHQRHYLQLAQKYIRWANATIRGKNGLFGGRSTPEGPMPYVEGPMAEALLRLCHATGHKAYCAEGEQVMRASAKQWPTPDMGPQFDALYIRAVLEIYKMDHNPRWYRIAEGAAQQALAHASDASGLETRMWDGRPISVLGTPAGKLQTHAATTSLFAFMAGAAPPPGG
jgi:uncharacterized protein YyaL (SSP411 family)